jgi:hypothetical protein
LHLFNATLFLKKKIKQFHYSSIQHEYNGLCGVREVQMYFPALSTGKEVKIAPCIVKGPLKSEDISQ